MKEKLKILLKIIFIINFFILNINCEQVIKSIDSITSLPYNQGGILLIYGSFSSFTSNQIKVIIGGEIICTVPRFINESTINCIFTNQEKLTPISDSFYVEIKIIKTGETIKSTTPIFKFSKVLINDPWIFEEVVYISLENNVIQPNNYNLLINDGCPTFIHKVSPKKDSSIYNLNFEIPSTVIGNGNQSLEFQLIDTVGFTNITFTLDYLTKFKIFPMKLPSPSIISSTKSIPIKVCGNHFGPIVNITYGSLKIDNIKVTQTQEQDENEKNNDDDEDQDAQNTCFSFNGIGFLSNEREFKITNGKFEIRIPFNITFRSPIIKKLTQSFKTLIMETSETGIDSSMLKVSLNMSNNHIPMVITKFNDQIIEATIPDVLDNDYNSMFLLSTPTTIINSSLLIQPIIDNVSELPVNGGQVTIFGSFINNALFKLSFSNSSEINVIEFSKGFINKQSTCSFKEIEQYSICQVPKLLDFNVSNLIHYSISATNYIYNIFNNSDDEIIINNNTSSVDSFEESRDKKNETINSGNNPSSFSINLKTNFIFILLNLIILIIIL
ncbi:hypothetical protein RB653_008721 [Dictyostelium firmibasis]|uniref:IPT/TIG domain-containing protein n=1 Tax=Dictyostelium firmibasis TaxID=79012 RepID=A0AAN7U116_9MYCE